MECSQIEKKLKINNMSDTKITEQIYNLLDKQFTQQRQFAAIRELRCGTGYRGLNLRRMDYLVISTNAGNEVSVFEVKASRADFLKDIKDLNKQKQARCFANRFYYVAPKDVVKDNELPAWAGLMELDYNSENKPYLYYKVTAPTLHNEPATWGLVAEIIRHNNKSKLDILLQAEKRVYEQQIKQLKDELFWNKREIEYLKKSNEVPF